MKKEEREEFDASINMTWEDAMAEATERALYEELQRQARIRQIAEIG